MEATDIITHKMLHMFLFSHFIYSLPPVFVFSVCPG